MKIEKKHLIIGGLAILSVALAAAYWQYTKIMRYCIGFKGLRVRSVRGGVFDFDILLLFMNKSDVNFKIKSQEYVAYLNDKKVAEVKNQNEVPIKANSSNIIPLNVNISLKSIGSLLSKDLTAIVTDPSKGKLKVDIKLKVSLFGITFSIPYTYKSTIKEIMSPSPEGQSENTMICK